ncbi:MAG: hypothetical protein ACKVVT_00060 [Dehalococcoidia bacterium]
MYRPTRPRSYALLLAGLLAIISMVPLALRDQQEAKAIGPGVDHNFTTFNGAGLAPAYPGNVTVAAQFYSCTGFNNTNPSCDTAANFGDMRRVEIQDQNLSTGGPIINDSNAPAGALVERTIDSHSRVVSGEGRHEIYTIGWDKNVALTGDGVSNVQGPFIVWIDLTDPTGTWTTTPAFTTANPAFSFTTANPGLDPTAIVSVECRVNGSPFAACVSPFAPGPLADGAHLVRLRVTDAAGNFSTTTHNFIVDTTAPQTTFTGGTAFSGAAGDAVGPFFTNTNAPYTFNLAALDPNLPNASDSNYFECSMDSAVGPWSPCNPAELQDFTTVRTTSTHTHAGALADGLHTLYASAWDRAGNGDASRATYQLFIDRVKPDTTISSGPGAYVNILGPFNFTLTGTDAAPSSGVDYFECRLDGGAWALCSGGGINDNTVTNPGTHTIAGPLGLGCHTLEARAEDRAGNLEDTLASWTWCIDTTPPLVTITANQQHYTGPAYTFGTWSKYNVFVHFACAEDLTDANYDSGIGTNTFPNGPQAFIVDGVYNINANPAWNCIDKAGNSAVGTNPALPLVVKTDQTNPVCTVKGSPTSVKKTGSTNVTISAAESDKTSGIASVILSKLYLNGTQIDTQSAPATGPQQFAYVSGSNIGGSLNGSLTGVFKFIGAKLRSWTAEVIATDNAGNTQLCKLKINAR